MLWIRYAVCILKSSNATIQIRLFLYVNGVKMEGKQWQAKWKRYPRGALSMIKRETTKMRNVWATPKMFGGFEKGASRLPTPKIRAKKVQQQQCALAFCSRHIFVYASLFHYDYPSLRLAWASRRRSVVQVLQVKLINLIMGHKPNDMILIATTDIRFDYLSCQTRCLK